MSQNGKEQMKRLESLIKLGSKDAIKDTDFVTSDELSKWFTGVVEVVKTLKESNDSTVQDILSHLSKIDKLVNNETQLTKKEQESLKNDLVSLKGELSKKLEDIRKDIPKEKDDVDLSLIPQETPISIKRKLESLKGEHAFDINKAKGADKFMTKETLERAVSILDNRTSFLINKINEVQKSVGNSGNSLSATNGQYKIFVTVGSSNADYLTGDYASDDLAMQAANNYVSGLGGGEVWILLGNYLIENDVNISSNVNFNGSGYGTFCTLSSGKSFKFNGVSHASIKGITIDGSSQSINNFGLLIRDSTDILVEKCYLENMEGFGIFIDSTASNTCSQIWVTKCYVQGNGNNDVIGGGPANSTGAVVSDIYIYGNKVVQDCTTNNYDNAFDIVAVQRVSVVNNDFFGKVQYGTEQFPNQNSKINDNNVSPAIGKTNTVILITTKGTATTAGDGFAINGNVINSGGIKAVGIAGQTIKRLTITGNVLKGVTLLNGIELTYCSSGTIVGNTIDSFTAATYFSNCDNFTVSANQISNCTNAVKDVTGVNTIIFSPDNILRDISGTAIIGANPGVTINMPAGGTNKGLLINQSGAVNGLNVRSSSSTIFTGTGDNSLNWFFLGNATDTGQLAQFRNAGTGDNVVIHNSETTSIGTGLLINQDANGIGQIIDTESTSQSSLQVLHDSAFTGGAGGIGSVFIRTNNASFTGKLFHLENAGSGVTAYLRTTGNGLSIDAATAGNSASAVSAVNISATNAGAGAAYGLIVSAGRTGLLTTDPTNTLTLGSTSTGIALFNTSDQVTNTEKGILEWSSNVLRLSSQNAGTGTSRPITIVGFSASASTTLTVTRSTLPFMSITHNAAVSSNGTFSSNTMLMSSTNGIQVAHAITPTITQTTTGGYTALLINPTESTTGSGAKLLLDLQVGGTSKTAISNSGSFSKYQGVTTTGWGIPAIYGTGRSTAQTAAVASVATYTVGAADGSFLVSANVNVTTSTVHTIAVQVDYTDETNTAQTLTLNFAQLSGAIINSITNVTGAGPYEGIPNHIRCKASTAITVKTTGTFTTVTYNVESSIVQIS